MTALEEPEGVPVPAWLMAVTRNDSAVPLASPVAVYVVAGDSVLEMTVAQPVLSDPVIFSIL